MAKKVMFIPNRWFKGAVFIMFLSAIFLVAGLRTDNLFYLLLTIVLAIFGLFFINKSLKSRFRMKKKK